MNRLQAIRPFGQRVWLDNLSAELIASGELARLIVMDGIAGVTSNPAIFYKAISGDERYQIRLSALQGKGLGAERRYEEIVIPDVQAACDLLAGSYRSSNGEDGYVSLEVSPHLADDFDGTLASARDLWQRVNKPNLMIKVPATRAGVDALRVLTSEGINVNVTLLFSLDQVEAVWDAYIDGLRTRQSAGGSLAGIKAVASFFLSRIDSLLDQKLPALLRGETAIALSKAAYARYQERFHGEEFASLRAAGASPQYLLWASTGTKNKVYSDVLYVESLIGPETINTIPDATLAAFRDHGVAAMTLTNHSEDALSVLREVTESGIDLTVIGEQLQQDGLKLFIDAFDQLLVLTA